MYSSAYPPSPSSPYDPYRSSPIPVAAKQPYNQAFSPPPQHPHGHQAPAFSPMPSGQSQRYQQYPQAAQQYRAPQGQYGYQQQPPPPAHAHPQPQQVQHPPPPQRHKGTLAPGQMVRVGDQQVRIERYLSEGGYAHVYLTTSDRPIYPPNRGAAAGSGAEKKGRWGEKGYTEHCLKRIAFEDDAVWVDVKKEIEVMKSLPPNPHLTQYLGSAHSRLPSGGHEVFILMEFCSGGGIIDLLNKRLRDRLKEIEILNIFTDVCEAVAAMHFLKQPLLHRDLKIENVLSQPISSPPTPQRPTPLIFKLCDFGSTTFPADRPPTSKVEADALAMDINRNTTLQYRSPEMVEPMLGHPVGLPSDVWALGCLLYKLCYYTTPFEEHGPLAIVNAKYTFPPVPQYSPRLQHLIASMLVEQPVRRPSVFEVLKESHNMSGTRPEVDYPIPSRNHPALSQQRPPARQAQSSSNLLDFTGSAPMSKTPVMQPSLASTVQPQRRGRPTKDGTPGGPRTAQAQVQGQGWQASPKQQPAQSTPTASSAGSRPPTAVGRMQVTGEKLVSTSTSTSKKAPTSAASPPALDAFGMPIMPTGASSRSTERGFGDSFSAPAPAPASLQAQAQATRPTQPGRYGSGLSAGGRPTGLGDTTGGGGMSRSTSGLSRAATVASRSPTKPAVAPKRVPSGMGASAPAGSKQASPTAPDVSRNKSPDPSSSIPDGELSFESRYPSIEALSSGDAFSPGERLISPIVSPPTGSDATGATNRPRVASRPSMMGNLTGGDLHSPQASTARGHQGDEYGGAGGLMPQPRSTHVTGTAFKGIQGGVRSPPLPSQTGQSQGHKGDYFGQAGAGLRPQDQPAKESGEGVKDAQRTGQSAKSPAPPDLMSGEEAGDLQVPSIVPGRSTSPASVLSPGSASSKVLPSPSAATDAFGMSTSLGSNGQGRKPLPRIDARPSSNFMSDNWSPLEKLRERDAADRLARENEQRMREGRKPKVPSSDPEVDSSDDEAVPEEPGRTVGGGSEGREPSRSPVRAEQVPAQPTKSTTLASTTPSLNPDSARPSAQRSVSGERARPQSMFVQSSAGPRSAGSVLSPPLREEPTSATSAGSVGSWASGSVVEGGAGGRPGHGRKGSINGMVSRYESLSVGEKRPTSGASTSNGANGAAREGLGRKPSVASKPAALRKSTLDEKRSQAEPPLSATSATSRPSRGASLLSPASPQKPSVAPKPTSVATSTSATRSRFPEPAGNNDVYRGPGSTTSASSARPLPKPKPTVITSSGAAGAERIGERRELEKASAGSSSSGQASPEKQQPVNMLIQRWNKGEVNNAAANAPKPPRRGGYI
ncbi:hypothetical protein IAT38_000450 [Cryptococcus sp. DSM 104549]